VDAGLARVVSAVEDPDPRVAGRGHEILRKAGIDVRVGVLSKDASRANLGHILRVTQGRPMVTLKLAETADGFAASANPHDPRLMITGQIANNRVQVMRAMHDAIMIGIGTALGDDPLLTVRMPGLEQRAPLRVVLDSDLRLPTRSRLVATAKEKPLLVIAGVGASPDKRASLEAQGVHVEFVARGADGHVDLTQALQALGARGITRVFSEGGPHVAGALIGQGLADEIVLIRGEKPFGRAGLPALSETARQQLDNPARFSRVSESRAGADRLIRYERVS